MTERRRTHYDVLGLRPSTNAAAIREAYLNLVRLVHPDRHHHGSSAERALAERRMREVTEAWAVLGDAASRARYDREIASWRAKQPGTDTARRDGAHRDRNRAGPLGEPVDHHDADYDRERNDEGIEVSRGVYHLLTKGPLVALIGVAFLILVFTAYARPSGTDPTTPGSTVWSTTSQTIGMDPDR